MAEYSCLIVEDSPMMRQLLVFALSRVKSGGRYLNLSATPP